jgi:hypothetical protein
MRTFADAALITLRTLYYVVATWICGCIGVTVVMAAVLVAFIAARFAIDAIMFCIAIVPVLLFLAAPFVIAFWFIQEWMDRRKAKKRHALLIAFAQRRVARAS